MKAGITGAGALGSLFASFFIRSGIETVIYEKGAGTVSSIRNGLKITTADGEYFINPQISADPSILDESDVVFLFVKSYSTSEVMEDISGKIKKEAVIVSLQNGLGNFDIIRGFVPEDRIVYGTTTYGAAKSSPSEIIFGGKGIVSIGGMSPSAVETAADLIRSAGCDVHVTENPERAVWMKALINAGINPVASILGIKNGQILENSFALQIQEALISEGVAAAESRNIFFDYGSLLAETRSICSKTAMNTCSMLQDLNAGRRTEIESINLKLAETGRSAGLDMTCNMTVSLIVKALEEKNLKINF